MDHVLWPLQGQHPLLGEELECHQATKGTPNLFEKCFVNKNFCIEQAPWIADHKIQGQVICPGMAFVEIFLECGRQAKAKGWEL